MSIRQKVLDRMNELQISAKKSLGQNFLISDSVIQKITSQVERLKPGSLIEIGPGLGSLTDELKKISPQMTVLELDRAFSQYWRDQGLHVEEGDALHWNWSSWKGSSPRVLVSNLPYQISSTLVIDRCLDAEPVDFMVLMFQKEVAQRMRAVKDSEHYGMLSVITQTFWQTQTLLDAGPGDFMPAPKVASRVLVFEKKQIDFKDRKRYFSFVKSAFLHPRKLMVSNLCEGLGITKAQGLEALEKHKLDPKCRAEQLSLQQFLDLSETLGYKI